MPFHILDQLISHGCSYRILRACRAHTSVGAVCFANRQRTGQLTVDLKGAGHQAQGSRRQHPAEATYAFCASVFPQDVAERIAREAEALLWAPRVAAMDAYPITGLPQEQAIVMVTSTTGQVRPASQRVHVALTTEHSMLLHSGMRVADCTPRWGMCMDCGM